MPRIRTSACGLMGARARHLLVAAHSAVVIVIAIVLSTGAVCAQEPGSASAGDPERFEKQSGALRTALHYDPSLEAPLAALAKLYSAADRGEELLQIYRTHTTQYPLDESARIVLIRLLREMHKPEAGAMLTRARKDFPQSAPIAYLTFLDLNEEKDPRALDALSEAIGAETRPGRKRIWTDQLVDLAVAEGRPDLATKHLTELAEAPGQTAEFLLGLARDMQRTKFHKLVLTTLDKARAINSSPELNIDIELLAAAAEGSLDQAIEAGKRLDALLEIVATDYWRRPEIVSRRVNLLRSDAAREKMLKAARARFLAEPGSESAALDLGELLVACELRRDALAVYLEASVQLPKSERIEKAVIDLFDRLNDLDRAREYLEARVGEYPDRLDLDYRLVKALFASGEKTKALTRFDGLLGKLDDSSVLEQTLDLARYLRRMGMAGSAADLFARIVEQAPERLDVRRELAETYLVIGRRQESRKLFTAELAEGAEIENFLDVVQFMIQQEILLEAEKAISKRLERDGGNFDLRLLLLDVQGKLGDEVAGERLLESTRAIADTEARYRSWFEAGAKFHELFETLDDFFDGEQTRLIGVAGEWTPRRVVRLLVFCDVADRSQERARVVEIVRAQIKSPGTPTGLRLELRRLLVRLLERDPTSIDELGENLMALEKEDGERSDEYRLRMGKMYLDAQRPDLGTAILDKVDVGKIGDPRLLTGLPNIFLNRGEPRKALAVLERVAKLEPSNRANWETWLTFLAAMGEEADLRHAIRRLMIGIDRMPLSEDTYTLLRGHLIDSYWRTIAHKLASGEAERSGEILSLLDAIERSGRLPVEQLWVVWTRAHVLNFLGRDRARDEAIAQLTSVATALGGKGEEQVMIDFPDGLAVSVEAAVRRLADPVPPAGRVKPDRGVSGPLPELVVDWAFATDDEIPIIQTLPIAGGDVILFDRRGTVYRVDGRTGKLIWRTTAAVMEAALEPADVSIPGGATIRRSLTVSRPVQARLLPECVADAEGNLMLPIREQVMCLSGVDGKPKWIGHMGGEAIETHSVTTPLILFIDGDRVLGYNRTTAVAAAFDCRNGKLLWEREVLSKDSATSRPVTYPLNDFSSGASLGDGHLLVYGRHAAVLDVSSGTTIWEFESRGARSFPIKLSPPDERDTGGSLMPAGSQWPLPSSQIPVGSRSYPGSFQSSQQRLRPSVNYLAAQQGRADSSNFARRGGKLVAPAASWAEYVGSGQPGLGVLAGNRMLLFGSGIEILSLDLPLAGQQRKLYRNSFLGISGNKACFLGDRRLSILNLSRNTMAVADLSWVVESVTFELHVTVAGARVYATGRKGIICINLHTGREIFRAPWPATVSRFFLQGDGEEPVGVEARPGAVHHWQGRIASAAAVRNSPYQQLMMQQSIRSAQARSATGAALPICSPISNAVDAGRLYALVAPHQLVALSQDGRNESTDDDGRSPKN